MKKRLLPILLLIAGSLSVKAQQDPQFTQFFLNRLNFNPAVAGSEEKICALGVYRNQWVGLGSSDKGANPVTYLMSINAPIGSKIGIGLNIPSDQLGFERSLGPTLSLSYRQAFSNGGVLAPGVSLGFMQKTIAGDKFKALDPNDPKIPNIPVAGNTMDIGAGLYYTQPTLSIFDKFYAGFSALHLNKGEIKYSWASNEYAYNLVPHYFVMTGAEYRISNTLAVDPNFMVKTDLTKTSVELNSMLEYNGKFRGGLTYRTSNDLSILLGYKFSPDFQMGYSYDFTLSNLSSYQNGSHEFVIKYCYMPHFTPKPPKPPVPILTPRFL